jgi:hypothetical protein
MTITLSSHRPHVTAGADVSGDLSASEETAAMVNRALLKKLVALRAPGEWDLRVVDRSLGFVGVRRLLIVGRWSGARCRAREESVGSLQLGLAWPAGSVG